MMMQSFGPGPGLRLSASSNPEGTGVPPLVLELGELERLRGVGVGQGVRLGLRRRVRMVSVTTPFFSCCGKSRRLNVVAVKMKIIGASNIAIVPKTSPWSSLHKNMKSYLPTM